MKFLPVLALIIATSFTPACAMLTQPQTPVTTITNAETIARTTLQNAQIGWLFVVPLITVSHPDKVQDLTTKYYAAVQKASDALDTLDKVKASLTSGVTVTIDLNTALKAESLAIVEVMNIIAEAKAASGKAKATQNSHAQNLGVPGYDNALAGSDQLRSMVK